MANVLGTSSKYVIWKAGDKNSRAYYFGEVRLVQWSEAF